jgi:polyhydroxybutyrate depolymerase
MIVCLAAALGTPVSVLALAPPGGACDTARWDAGEHALTVHSGGLARAVRVFVPPAAATHRALPLVLDLHGSGGNGAQQARSTRLSDVGARHGFVVANPDGGVSRPDAPERHYWNIPGVPLSGGGAIPDDAPDDVQFIRDTIGQVSANLCIDPRRVYVTGMSGGARMASLLGCRMADRIAAIAPVSGLRAGLPSTDDPQQPDPTSCQPQRPLPIVTFHGTDDHTNPYDGGGPPYWAYSVSTALHRWIELDHCEGQPEVQQAAPHVTLVRYSQCAGGAQIWFYRTELPGNQGGGHAWPGGTPPASFAAGSAGEQQRANTPGTEINASELLWEFFSRFELPALAAVNPGQQLRGP